MVSVCKNHGMEGSVPLSSSLMLLVLCCEDVVVFVSSSCSASCKVLRGSWRGKALADDEVSKRAGALLHGRALATVYDVEAA